MSHIATFKTGLKGVDPELITRAFMALVQDRPDWVFTQTVFDYTMNNPTECIAAVITPNTQPFPYGVGVNIDANGELVFVGDLDMQPWQSLKQDIQNYYVALGYAACGDATISVHDAVKSDDVQIELEISL
jgi:hypothetical protein